MRAWTKFAIVTLLLLVTTTLEAQLHNNYTKEYYIGVNGGATLSTMRFSPTLKQTMKLGVNTGVTMRYIAEKYFGLQAEVNFQQRGWAEKVTLDNPNTYNRTLNYIEVPFLTHIFFNAGPTRIFVNLGPKICFLIGDSEVNNYGEPNESMGRGKAVENRVDYGVCGGLGFEFRSKIGTFGIDGRYYFGLGDIFNNSKSDPFEASANQVISANAYYLIPFKSKKR